MAHQGPVSSAGLPTAGDSQQRSRSATPTAALRGSLTDMKSFLVEKEMLESQMRKLSLENSTLQMENKLLKDKYNRSVARVSELESNLQENKDELEELQGKIDQETSRVTRSVRSDFERQLEQQQIKANSAIKEGEILKSQMTYLEQQLNSAKKEVETIKENTDKTKIHEAYSQESSALKEEISHLKHLLEESEKALEAECARTKEMSGQIKQLMEIRDVLQLQVEEGGTGGTAAEKQAASLQMRLRLTEERLTQERADRAGNLSQIEEKLLTENAKLQTKEKELERQLKREREKSRGQELRVQEFREDNLKLRLAMPDEDEKNYDIPYSRHSTQRQDGKKPAYDIKQILQQLETESGLSGDSENKDALLLYMWELRQDLQQQLKEWRLYLQELDLPEGEDDSSGLQSALAMKEEYEAKMLQTEERIEDVSAERITAEQTYKQQLTELVKERHDAFARLQTLNDLMDALRAENETLREGLATTSGHMEVRPGAASTGQVEALQEEVSGLEARVGQLTRKNKVAETEMVTLRSQLSARDKELRELRAELQAAHLGPASDPGQEQIQAHRLQALTTEIAELKEEIRLQSDKCGTLQSEKHRLESEVEETRSQLRNAKKKSREQDLGSSLTQKHQVEGLEKELEQKDGQILQLSAQHNESESSLHQARAELAIQRRTQEELEAQISAIQRQLDERCQVLDEMTAREGEQMEQLELVKDMIHSLNQGLSHRQGETEVLQLELQQAKEKISWLEEQKSNLNDQLAETGQSGTGSRVKGSAAATDLRVSELESEREQMKLQLLQNVTASVSLREEVESLNTEVIKAQHEASTARASNTQASNEQAVLQRRVQTLEEEKKMRIEERDNCKVHLANAEASLQEVVSKFETEGRTKYDGFTTEYHDDSPEGQKLIGEVHTLRLLTFAKDKENSVIMDKMRRQEEEKKNVEKMCGLLESENGQGRKDISRITNELVLKMKENSAAMEVNRVLVRDQASTLKKLASVEAQLTQEKERTDRRRAEVNEVIRKIEHSEQAHQSTSLTLQQKDSVIGDLEVRLHQVTKDLSTTESERDSLKVKVDQLSDDVRALSNVNTGLEKKLETNHTVLQEEQNSGSKRREEITSLNHKMEVLKHEQNLLLGNLTTERKTQEKLKEEIKSHEEEEKKLREKIAELTGELETQKGHLIAAKETVQQTKAEKETFMKDYHDACRRLGEKETAMQEMQKKSEKEITVVRQETLKQSQAVSLEKANTTRDLSQLRQEVEDLKQQLSRKDAQIGSFNHTLKELEDAQRQNKDLENYISEQDKISAESKLLVESLRKELMSLRDENSNIQDTVARKEVVILDLKDQLRSSGESTESQVTEMRHTIDGMRSHHEFEKKTLRDALNKVEENLKSSVQEVRTLMDAKDHLSEQTRTQERALSEVNYKLSQEVAARKVSEEKLEQIRETVDDAKRKKVNAEEKANSLQMSMNKAEADHTVMRERIKNLTTQLKDVETALAVSEGAVKAGEDKVEGLKTELLRHQQSLESLKQQSGSKLRKLTLDLQQQGESQEKEQLKLTQQCHQLSVDLEQAREMLAVKSKENLKLQEEMLELQEQVREGASKLRQTQDSLKHEEEMQTRLSYRFEEQESELKQLRNFLAKKADEDGDGKGMWQEMNRVISELSRQLQFHMETSRLMEQGNRDNSSELVHRLRRSLLEAESQLNTERALHQVTRSSMQALDEDCSRLRQMLYAMKRRGTRSEKKPKSRMEEINEIIARSQTRAQAMLASGEYSLDSSLRNMNPSRDYNVGDSNFSPDTSVASDASFTNATLANLSFLNLSGTHNTVSPRK
ncbi:golgin subfamily A member 4 isoform X2 [Aplysia californica]|nr:golgin subfamily A member 4 isoform X2 [Aplysia californica]